MISKILASTNSAKRRIVWTCIFEACGSNAEGNISYNYDSDVFTKRSADY